MIIEIYSDGSSNGQTLKQDCGGWAFVVIVDGVKVHEGSGGTNTSTNNTMELQAAVEGLKYVAANPAWVGAQVSLVADSQLVLNYANGTYRCRKLHLAMLHSNLTRLYKQLNATTRWVRGHTGDKYNEECDVLAKAQRETLMQKKR